MAKKTKRLCRICYVNPPEVPDRNSGSPIKRVCAKCHANLLRGDLLAIEVAERKRDALSRPPHNPKEQNA